LSPGASVWVEEDCAPQLGLCGPLMRLPDGERMRDLLPGIYTSATPTRLNEALGNMDGGANAEISEVGGFPSFLSIARDGLGAGGVDGRWKPVTHITRRAKQL
jgi:hypothetical protein